jgi:hypothetical protein
MLLMFTVTILAKGHENIGRINNGHRKSDMLILIIDATLCQRTDLRQTRLLSRNETKKVKKVAALFHERIARLVAITIPIANLLQEGVLREE